MTDINFRRPRHARVAVVWLDGNSYEFKDTVTYSKTAGTFHIVTQSYINGAPAGVDSITTNPGT